MKNAARAPDTGSLSSCCWHARLMVSSCGRRGQDNQPPRCRSRTEARTRASRRTSRDPAPGRPLRAGTENECGKNLDARQQALRYGLGAQPQLMRCFGRHKRGQRRRLHDCVTADARHQWRERGSARELPWAAFSAGLSAAPDVTRMSATTQGVGAGEAHGLCASSPGSGCFLKTGAWNVWGTYSVKVCSSASLWSRPTSWSSCSSARDVMSSSLALPPRPYGAPPRALPPPMRPAAHLHLCGL